MMPPQTKKLTALYGERKLQTSVTIPYNTPYVKAKELGENSIRQQLSALEKNAVPHIDLDPECTELFQDDANDEVTVIGWPAGDPSMKLAPSPMVDAFVGMASELRDFRTKEVIELFGNNPPTSTDSGSRNLKKGKKKKKDKGKQPVPSASDNSAARQPSEDSISQSEILRRFKALETDNKELKADVCRLESELTNLRQEVLTDRSDIDKIRLRALLDLARDELASLCGHRDWEDWKQASGGNRDDMVVLAKARVLAHQNNAWKDLAQHPTAFRFILTRNAIRHQGNMAAHDSRNKDTIARSLYSLEVSSQARTIMTQVFKAYYDQLPTEEGFE